MIATTNGKLAGLYVDNEIKDEKKVLDLKVYLDQKYGTGKIVEGSFNKKAFKWESNQFIIQIPIGKTTSFDQLETFTFFMINKNFTDEISLLKTGEWIEFIFK